MVALVAHGLSNDQIAGAMVLSPATAKTHVSRAMIKLGARDRAQRRDVKADEAECEAADDCRHEGNRANLDRDGEAGEKNVALIPDQAFPVAHAVTRASCGASVR